MSARELNELAEVGDEGARGVLRLSARKLGGALALLIDILNPERIVIGSVYARAERWFREDMLREIRREALDMSAQCCEIVPAALGDSIGDIAALSVAWDGLWGMKE